MGNFIYVAGLGCVNYYSQHKTWYDARATCKMKHSDLAVIDPSNGALELSAYHQFLGKQILVCNET